MSKDSSFTYVHFHASHHADLFEEFCHPPSSTGNTIGGNGTLNAGRATTATTDPSDPSLAHVPGHFLPFESINLPPHLMPINPEDEDGIVPDMHAAFGINRALGQAGAPEASGEQSGRGINARAEDLWRDFGLENLANGITNLGLENEAGPNLVNGRVAPPVINTTTTSRVGTGRGPRREGRRHGILSIR